MTRIAKHLQSIEARAGARPQPQQPPMSTSEDGRDKAHRARWWVTYPGNARGMLGAVVGPTEKLGGENVVAVAWAWDARNPDVTRVGFALATLPDVVKNNRIVDEELEKQARLNELLGGLRVAGALQGGVTA